MRAAFTSSEQRNVALTRDFVQADTDCPSGVVTSSLLETRAQL
jgi:hypothetical protein